jgi:hypothetical protein
MVAELSSLRQRQMLTAARALVACCGAAMLLCVTSPARAQEPSLGAFVLAGLTDVCLPVIERGESLSETAGKAGFLEVTGENRASLGGSQGMSWWMYEFAEAVLVVGRDLEQAGSACQIAASVPIARIGRLYEEIGQWAAAASPGFQQTGQPSSRTARDAQWTWERSAGGSIQQLRLSLTRHKDGTANSTLVYGLLPPRNR